MNKEELYELISCLGEIEIDFEDYPFAFIWTGVIKINLNNPN